MDTLWSLAVLSFIYCPSLETMLHSPFVSSRRSPCSGYAYNRLLQTRRAREKGERLAKWNYSAGVIAFNWALNKRLPVLSHHNVFLSDQFRESWARASGPHDLIGRPNFYLHAPARTDPTAAPPGGDAITVLVPVANLAEAAAGTAAASGRKDDTAMEHSFVESVRVAVFRRLEEAGVGDLRQHITAEFVYTPRTWRDKYNLFHGAAFGLAHDFFQLAYFRPSNADPDVKGLYFVGASTRPGNGVPLALMGAGITAERIFQEIGPRER